MGCFASAAIGLAGELWNRPDWISRALTGNNGFVDQLRAGVPIVNDQVDGLWGEGTLFYHFYSLTTLIPLRELALRHNVKIAPEILRRFEAMFDAPLQLSDAQGRLPALSDFGAPRHFSLALYRHVYEYAAGKLNLNKYGPALSRIYEQIGAPRTDLAALAFGAPRLPAALQLAPRASRLPVAKIGVFPRKSAGNVAPCFVAANTSAGTTILIAFRFCFMPKASKFRPIWASRVMPCAGKPAIIIARLWRIIPCLPMKRRKKARRLWFGNRTKNAHAAKLKAAALRFGAPCFSRRHW